MFRANAFFQILVQFRVDLGDIWVPGGMSGVLLVVLGRPWGTWGVQCRFLIDSGSPMGVPLGNFWIHFGLQFPKSDSFDMMFSDFL